jgi:hypothetical protein
MLCSYKAFKPCEILGSPSDVAAVSGFLVYYIMLTAKELILDCLILKIKDYDPSEFQ